VLPHVDRRHRATARGIRRQDVEFDSRERYGDCCRGRGRRNTKEDRVCSWIARAQTRLAVVAGACRPVVVVRRWTVMMVSVIVTIVRMHMDRGRPRQGPNHDDRHAGVEGPTHGESLSQHVRRGQKRCHPAKHDLTSRRTSPVY
jgi:hypothetical protein